MSIHIENFADQTVGVQPTGWVLTRAVGPTVNLRTQVRSGFGGDQAAVTEFPAGASYTGGFISGRRVWEWQTPPPSSNGDVLVQFTIVNAYSITTDQQQQLDWGIGIRCDDAVNSGYVLRKDAAQGDLELLRFEVTAGAGMVLGTASMPPMPDGAYWARLRVVEGGGGTQVLARVWSASVAEPGAWMIDEVDAVGVRPMSGLPSIMSGGFSTNNLADDPPAELWFSYVRYEAGFDPPAPIYPGRQDARDRLRSAVSEDTGSLLDAVQAIPVDARVTEAYTRSQFLEPQVLTLWREALRDKDGPPDFAYYPRPRQNVLEESQYDGVTVLSRLRNYYPPRVFATTAELGLPDPATAQELVTFLLQQWAADVPWLTYKPVPDLRLRLPGFTPNDYGPEDGLVTSHVFAFPQGRDDRRDALTIIEDLLSPFPGAVARQASDGDLIIVTPYGPDADQTPFLRLSGHDAYSVSRGDPDPYSVTNRATYSSQGWERHEEVATMQPAWFQVGWGGQFGRPTWYTPPGDRLNLQPTDDGTGVLQESLDEHGPFNDQVPQLWPIASTAIPAGTGISLRDGSSNPTITAAWSRYVGDSLDGTGTGTIVLLEDEIPFDGHWRTTFRFQETATSGEAIRITVDCRWNAILEGVEFRFRQPLNLHSTCFLGTCRGWVVEFTLNDSSVAYAPGSINTGTYGVIDTLDPENSDVLPGEGGVNAIEVSQAAFGILEANVRIRGYVLRPDILAQIAQAHVVENITPKVTRELEISIFSGLRVQFDHIGRLTELPNTDVGHLTGVTYRDDFEADQLAKTTRVEVRDYAAPGAIDTTTVFLTLLNGSYWQFVEPPMLPIASLEQT